MTSPIGLWNPQMDDGRLLALLGLLGLTGAAAAKGSRGVVRRGRNVGTGVIDALIDELRETHNAAGAMEVDGERVEGVVDQIALWGTGSDDRPFNDVYQITSDPEEAFVWLQDFAVGAKLLSSLSTGRGSSARRSRTGQELRSALETWNGDKRLSWNDVASQYGFESEAAAMLAVRRYAAKYDLKVRRVAPVNDEVKRQQALVFHEAGLSNKDIAHRLGYQPTSVSSVLAAARRMRLLDKLYGKAKNPLRKKPEGSRGVVRGGRASTTKTIQVSYGVTTEDSLEAGDYADVGLYSGDSSFISMREVGGKFSDAGVPWTFTPDDAPYLSDDDGDPHLATVRAVAAQILRFVGKEWPSTNLDPLPRRDSPKYEEAFGKLAEALLRSDATGSKDHLRLLGIDDGLGLYYASTRKNKIDGSPINGVDFEVELGEGWRTLDVLRLLDLVLPHHDAKARLTR